MLKKDKSNRVFTIVDAHMISKKDLNIFIYKMTNYIEFHEAYAYDFTVYPFTLTIYYPSLDKNERFGRTPMYIKVLPRGYISNIRSDYSTLELMTVNK